MIVGHVIVVTYEIKLAKLDVIVSTKEDASFALFCQDC